MSDSQMETFEESNNSSFPTDYGGWTCGRCGSWVPNGTTHICTGYPLYPSCHNCQIFAKIDMLLEKITKLIEVMEAKRE